MRRSRLHAAAVVALTLGAASESHAQSRAADIATAQTLFDEAKSLVKAGKYADACSKFEESERLDSGPGTEFNLGDCYQRAGRTASAWAEFLLVADSLRAAGQRDREMVARGRATALEPKLVKLVVSVPSVARAAGLEVRRDAEVVRQAQWEAGVPVDPGQHALAASAPGMDPWKTTVDVTGEGKTITVEVPVLTPTVRQQPAPLAAPAAATIAPPSPPPPPQESPATSPPPPGSGQRVAAVIVAGAGVVAIGVGSYFGVETLSKHSEYESHCPNNACDPTGLQLHSDASSDATISTVAIGVGAAAVVGGVVLWMTAPKSEGTRTGLRVRPSVGARTGGLFLEGAW